MVIAPVFGFDDYQDYYRKTQSGQFLKGVRVPLLAVQVTRRDFPRHVGRDWQIEFKYDRPLNPKRTAVPRWGQSTWKHGQICSRFMYSGSVLKGSRNS